LNALRKVARVLAFVALGAIVLLGGALGVVWFRMVRMPGTSASAALPPPTAEESALASRLAATVQELAGKIGARNVARPAALAAAADVIERELTQAGLSVARESFDVEGVRCDNLVAEVHGVSRATEVVVVGAHYDSADDAPGANDNGSGVAVLLELARGLASSAPARTVRFVAFVNEEPPYFRKADRMGSRVHVARAVARGDRVVGMLSLETMGWFSDAPGSQKYPFPFSLYYPDRGDFIGFVSSSDSAELVRDVVGRFRERASIPSQGGALPARLPGVGWSDHESYTLVGVPALMVTDTAPFRYPHYHTTDDTPDKVDVARLARVTVGLAHVVRGLASAPR